MGQATAALHTGKWWMCMLILVASVMPHQHACCFVQMMAGSGALVQGGPPGPQSTIRPSLQPPAPSGQSLPAGPAGPSFFQLAQPAFQQAAHPRSAASPLGPPTFPAAARAPPLANGHSLLERAPPSNGVLGLPPSRQASLRLQQQQQQQQLQEQRLTPSSPRPHAISITGTASPPHTPPNASNRASSSGVSACCISLLCSRLAGTPVLHDSLLEMAL